jgi:hypothetical protein
MFTRGVVLAVEIVELADAARLRVVLLRDIVVVEVYDGHTHALHDGGPL